MQDSSIGRMAQVLIHLDIIRQLNLELPAGITNLLDSFFTGKNFLSGKCTCTRDDTIKVHVATLLVFPGCPVFAQHLRREGFGLEDVVEDGARLDGGHVELTWTHEVADNAALLDGQSVVFAVLSGGKGA